MSDPLTALMYAVQVMNFLKNLIIRTLREREDSVIESAPASRLEPTDENGHQNASQPSCEEDEDATEENEWEKSFVAGVSRALLNLFKMIPIPWMDLLVS
jgi:hypothetical protein